MCACVCRDVGDVCVGVQPSIALPKEDSLSLSFLSSFSLSSLSLFLSLLVYISYFYKLDVGRQEERSRVFLNCLDSCLSSIARLLSYCTEFFLRFFPFIFSFRFSLYSFPNATFLFGALTSFESFRSRIFVRVFFFVGEKCQKCDDIEYCLEVILIFLFGVKFWFFVPYKL